MQIMRYEEGLCKLLFNFEIESRKCLKMVIFKIEKPIV